MAEKYKPPKFDSGGFGGAKGIAETRISEDKKSVLIRFEDGKKHKIARTKETKNLFPGLWFIQLNKEEDSIQTFRPVNGSFEGVVEKFSAREGEEPAPKTKLVSFTRKDGTAVDYEKVYFWVIIKIVRPEKYAGILVSKEFRYNFREVTVNGQSLVTFASKGDRTRDLEEFCDLTDVWNRGAMKWSDNVLPELEKRILREGKHFMFIMKGGWIDTLYEVDITAQAEKKQDAPDDDWEEDTVNDIEPDVEEDELPWDEA